MTCLSRVTHHAPRPMPRVTLAARVELESTRVNYLRLAPVQVPSSNDACWPNLASGIRATTPVALLPCCPNLTGRGGDNGGLGSIDDSLVRRGWCRLLQAVLLKLDPLCRQPHSTNGGVRVRVGTKQDTTTSPGPLSRWEPVTVQWRPLSALPCPLAHSHCTWHWHYTGTLA